MDSLTLYAVAEDTLVSSRPLYVGSPGYVPGGGSARDSPASPSSIGRAWGLLSGEREGGVVRSRRGHAQGGLPGTPWGWADDSDVTVPRTGRRPFFRMRLVASWPGEGGGGGGGARRGAAVRSRCRGAPVLALVGAQGDASTAPPHPLIVRGSRDRGSRDRGRGRRQSAGRAPAFGMGRKGRAAPAPTIARSSSCRQWRARGTGCPGPCLACLLLQGNGVPQFEHLLQRL